MRLIDADALHSTLADWQLMLSETYGTNDEFVRCLEDVLCTVDNTPTIAAPRWVRCEEEMPKEMKVVVTYGKGRVSFGYCMFLYDADMEKDVCEWVDTHSNRMEVTHWMPLPEPPKEEQ